MRRWRRKSGRTKAGAGSANLFGVGCVAPGWVILFEWRIPGRWCPARCRNRRVARSPCGLAGSATATGYDIRPPSLFAYVYPLV